MPPPPQQKKKLDGGHARQDIIEAKAYLYHKVITRFVRVLLWS